MVFLFSFYRKYPFLLVVTLLLFLWNVIIQALDMSHVVVLIELISEVVVL